MEIVNITSAIENFKMSITGIISPKADPKRDVYTPAHARAASDDPNFTMAKAKANQFYLQSDTKPATLWFNLSPKADPTSASGWFKLNN